MELNVLFLIVLQPWLMSLSRTIWLTFFVKYNHNWKDDVAEEPEVKFEQKLEIVNR